jgi:hypothetical protein
MATAIGGSNLTLQDWAKQLEPNGGVTTDIVEMLAQKNAILLDMPWKEANGPTTHRYTVRTGMPTATWRQFYQGVASTKSNTAQVDEPMGMLEARSVVDQKLANLNGDVAQFRMNEAGAFLEAMNQEVAGTVFYGNVATAATEFNGLAPRFADNTTAATKENIVLGGSSDTDNTSIWLVGWGEPVFGIFPKGSTAGLKREDLGVIHNWPDADGGTYSVLMDKFTWDVGLAVKDWRYIVRIPNIDISNLIAESSAADILKLMTVAIHKLPDLTSVRPAFYCNRTLMTALDIQAQNKANVYLTVGGEEGQPKVSFRGIPIRMCDQILSNETAVS